MTIEEKRHFKKRIVVVNATLKIKDFHEKTSFSRLTRWTLETIQKYHYSIRKIR